MRLGVRQLELLRATASGAALVIPTARSRRLCDLGLMRAHSPGGGFAHCTPKGLRALADAVERGRITLFTPPSRSQS